MKLKVSRNKVKGSALFLGMAMLLCGCQNDEIVNRQDMDGMTVRYAVASDCPVQGRAEMGNAGTMLTLTGNGDSLSIPMEWTVTDGIGISPTPDGTKGTLVNTTGDDNMALSEFASLIGNTFVAKAFDGEGAEKVSQTVTWSTTSSAWVGAPEAKWPKGTSLDFLAYANLPGSQTATITKDGVSTVHTVPASAADQTDILFGHYQGDGGSTHTAAIRFEHPLTAVRFIRGKIDESLIIKSIELCGVAETGTVAMDAEGTITWSEVDAHDYTVSQEGDATTGLPVNGTTGLIGEPFIIIPQNLADESVMVSVTFTNGQTVAATLDAGQWNAGYTNTYTISTDLTTTVIVSVDDEVSGTVKSNLVVANVGTSAAFMRVALVGFWVNSDNDIVDGWDMGQGVFADFPGTDWTLGADGYYYYTYPVRGATPDPVETGTKLFSTYTAPEAPDEDATLELNIIVQGVKYDQEKAGVAEAWGSAAAGLLNATFKEE